MGASCSNSSRSAFLARATAAPDLNTLRMACLCLTMSSPASHGFFFASPPAAAGLLVLGLEAFWREAFEGLELDPPPKRHGLLARAGTLAV